MHIVCLLLPRFGECCQRALDSALKLVSRCSGYGAESLEKWYRASCQEGVFDHSFDDPPEEEDEDMDAAVGIVAGKVQSEAFDLLQGIKDESDLTVEGIKEVSKASCDLGDVPDREQLEELIGQGPGEASDFLSPKENDSLPSTLGEALRFPGSWWNNLFRLAVRLRSAKGGSDTFCLPNAKNCRRAAKGLNWHQFNERLLAQMEASCEDAQYRGRAGRLDKWRELSRVAREQLRLPLEDPERLQHLSRTHCVSSGPTILQCPFVSICGFVCVYVYACVFISIHFHPFPRFFWFLSGSLCASLRNC